METVKTISTEALLDSLTEYYERSRRILKESGNEREYLSCRLKIDSILRELNDRNITQSPAERVDFRFGETRRSAG